MIYSVKSKLTGSFKSKILTELHNMLDYIVNSHLRVKLDGKVAIKD